MSSYICPVCRDLLSEPRDIDPNVDKNGYDPVITYCGHMFHFHCLMGWFNSQHRNGQLYSCPSCWERVLDLDVVKMYPAMDDKYENYNSLHKKCEKLSLDVQILTCELENANAKNYAWEEMVAQSDEKIEELKEKIEKLEILVDRNKEATLTTQEMSPVLFETAEQSAKSDNKKDIISEFIPGLSHQTELMSVVISFEKEEKVKKIVKSIGNLGDVRIQIPVVLYTHRGKMYSPEFELFQLQFSTFLRMCGIHHSCQVLTMEEDNEMPIMILGETKIFETYMCCAAIKDCFYLTEKVQVLHLKSAEPKSLTIIQNILNTTILWGLLLWQWVHNDGKSMRIFPRKYSNEFRIAMKKNLQIIASDKIQSFLDKDVLFQNVSNDIRILSEQLGQKYYFSGPLPGEVDASAFILLSQMLWNSVGSPFAEHVSNCKNLVDFILRIKHVFWPDWGNGAHLPHL